jgi:hypothetical protein
MAQITFTGDTTPNQADLDANFGELYGKTAWSSTGIGYATGAGGTVTQTTNKGTTVTLDKVCGQITMNNAALASGATVEFLLANTMIDGSDTVVFTQNDSITGLNYNIWGSVGTAYCRVMVRNISGGSRSEAIVINFVVIKGVTS